MTDAATWWSAVGADAPAEGADCERRDTWLLDQDVNAWTSLAYVAVGALVVALAAGRRIRTAFAALGVVAVAEGIGSLLYHGGSGDAAQFLHDVPLAGALGFVAGWHVARLGRGAPAAADRGALIGLGAATSAGSAVWVAGAGWINLVVGVLVVVTAGAELLARRRGDAAVWNAGLIAIAALAASTWWAGTSDSPLCEPRSWLQPHGAWHVLTALLLVGWVDQASWVAEPARAPRLWRRAVDRAFGLLATVAVLAFHRSVDVIGRSRFPDDRPVLVVANHGNGFVDPLVVTRVLGRLPRFLAKAALWRVVVARPFLALAGVLPVHRSSDGAGTGDNRSIFAACHQELARGSTVAIFPEGTTGDRAGLDRVRSGAARIALGAVATAPELVIVPIGLAFEGYVETRSRAVVELGEPIAVAAYATVGDDREPDRGDVRRLTSAITDSLEAVSPQFGTVDERDVMRAAARTTLNAERRRGEAPFGDVERLARRMGAAPPERRGDVVEAYRRYATRLQLAGITDEQLDPAGVPIARLVASAFVLAVAGSLVVTAALIHLPAMLLVVAATGAVRSTATKGTVRVLVGLAAGLATWIVAGALLADGSAAVLAGLTIAAQGALALAVWTPLTRAARTIWASLVIRGRGSLLAPVREERARLGAVVGSVAIR